MRDVVEADRLWHTEILPMYDGGQKDNIISRILALGQEKIEEQKKRKLARGSALLNRHQPDLFEDPDD